MYRRMLLLSILASYGVGITQVTGLNASNAMATLAQSIRTQRFL